MWTLQDPWDTSDEIITSPSGGALLYPKGYFAWGGMPYPYAHARLACVYLDQGKQEKALELARFQRLLCDSHGKLIASLWNQEHSGILDLAQEQTDRLFERLGFPDAPEIVEDPILGMVRHARSGGVQMITGSGCMTGLGCYLFGSVGVLSFGPQLSPLGDISQFGIAGKPWDWTTQGASYRYVNRLATTHPRHTGLSWLRDAGYSDSWIEVQHTLDETGLSTRASIVGSQMPRHWTILGIGDRCVVARCQGLRARSLDRYFGPIQPIEFRGESGVVEVDLCAESGYMEIHPVNGEQDFWGAHFLVTCTQKDPRIVGPWHFSYRSPSPPNGHCGMGT